MQDILYLIDQAHNIRTTGQLRFVICLVNSDEKIGVIDLFDANFKHGRAGVGILIGEHDKRSHGFATESVEILKEYVLLVLGFHSLFCSIHADNESSIILNDIYISICFFSNFLSLLPSSLLTLTLNPFTNPNPGPNSILIITLTLPRTF